MYVENMWIDKEEGDKCNDKYLALFTPFRDAITLTDIDLNN